VRGTGPSRRLVAAAIAAAALTGTLVGLLQGSSRPSSPPQGGSRFAAASASRPNESLIDALAPLLAPETGSAASGRAPLTVSLARGVAQLFVVGLSGAQPSAAALAPLRAHDWGGVVLGRGNYRSPSQVAALTAAIEVAIRSAGTTPPLIIARQGGGDSNAFPGLAPNSEPALGAVGRADLVNGQSQLAARQLRAVGVNGTLTPDADIGDPAGPAASRAYSSNPVLVRRLVTAAVAGYRSGGLISIVGHFPGEGAASQSPEQGAATVGLTLPDLVARDLPPFAAVVATAPVIQMSDALYDAFDGVTPATLLPDAVALLRQRLAYRGVVMSGNLEATAIATGGSVASAAVAALQAGCDLLYVPGPSTDAEAAYGAVIESIRQGRLSPAVVAHALVAVRALKRAYRIT
jgi:beta-N-acetylhexosaminidase